MQIPRVIAAGFAVNVLSIVIPLLSYKLFGWIFHLEPRTIWKWTPDAVWETGSTGRTTFIIFANTVLSLYFAALYGIIHKGIPAQGVSKGLLYSLLLYPVGVLIPMYSIYVLLNIADAVIIYFALEGLVEYVIYGGVVASIYEQKAESRNETIDQKS